MSSKSDGEMASAWFGLFHSEHSERSDPEKLYCTCCYQQCPIAATGVAGGSPII